MLKTEKFIFLLIIISYSFFYNGAQGNQLSRYNVIFNFVEPSSSQYQFVIDKFVPNGEGNTIDWSYYNNHYYSNKAPGPTLLGIPVYFCLYNIEKILGIHNLDYIYNLNIFLINFFVTILPVSFSAIYFFKLCNEKFSSEMSVSLTMILFLATALFPYSTALWGHCTATAFLIISIYEMLRKNGSTFIFSFCLGMGVLSDYILIPIAFFLAIIHLVKTKHLSEILKGISIPAGCFLGYNYICFDNIFSLPQQYSNPIFIEKSGMYGMLGKIDFQVLYSLLFSSTRGIIYQMPVLLFAFLGIINIRKNDYCKNICLVAAIFILLLNSGFNGWHGGRTVCARYLILSMPFLVLLIGYANLDFIKINILKLLAIFSYLNMAAVTFVNPLSAEIESNPLFDVVYPTLFSWEYLTASYLPIRNTVGSILETTTNLFALMGIPQISAFYLYILIQVIAIYFVFRSETTKTDL